MVLEEIRDKDDTTYTNGLYYTREMDNAMNKGNGGLLCYGKIGRTKPVNGRESGVSNGRQDRNGVKMKGN